MGFNARSNEYLWDSTLGESPILDLYNIYIYLFIYIYIYIRHRMDFN
jgi:hypothetical protein